MKKGQGRKAFERRIARELVRSGVEDFVGISPSESETQRGIADLVKRAERMTKQPIKKFIPLLHFQTNKEVISDVRDDIYRLFRRHQLPVQATHYGDYFSHTEEFQGQTVITICKLSSNFRPEYDIINKDGTVDFGIALPLKTEGDSCITVQLLAYNPYRGPEDLLADGGLIPMYETLKFELYEMTERRPLVDDARYRAYVKSFSPIGRWIVMSSTPPNNRTTNDFTEKDSLTSLLGGKEWE